MQMRTMNPQTRIEHYRWERQVIVDDDGLLAAERIAGTAVETLSEESCQERYPEHSPAQALVRVQERVAADPAQEGDSQIAQTPAQDRKTPQSVTRV